jgi:hypothetical protein
VGNFIFNNAAIEVDGNITGKLQKDPRIGIKEFKKK